MPTKPPTTYDDIQTNTVIEPDGFHRPSREQVEKAFDGSHTRTRDDLHLLAVVQAALHTHRDTKLVYLEVRDGRVDLRGSVSAASSLDEVEELVKKVPGVDRVINNLVVSR